MAPLSAAELARIRDALPTLGHTFLSLIDFVASRHHGYLQINCKDGGVTNVAVHFTMLNGQAITHVAVTLPASVARR